MSERFEYTFWAKVRIPIGNCTKTSIASGSYICLSIGVYKIHDCDLQKIWTRIFLRVNKIQIEYIGWSIADLTLSAGKGTSSATFWKNINYVSYWAFMESSKHVVSFIGETTSSGRLSRVWDEDSLPYARIQIASFVMISSSYEKLL